MTFDINFEVSVVSGPPHSWSVAIVDFQKGAAAAAKGGQAKDAEELSLIPCGKPFYLEIEALDQCHNRWVAVVTEQVHAQHKKHSKVTAVGSS